MSADNRSEDSPGPDSPTRRDFVDAYYRPGDSYTEFTNPAGDVVGGVHADGPTYTESNLEGDGASYKMSGRPHHQEEGTGDVCIRLANALSHQTGILWTADDHEPPGPEDGTDWIIRSGNRFVKVQVTRVGSQRRWAELGSKGHTTGTATTAEAAADVVAAIERKLHAQHPETTLALHCGEPGYYGFPRFIEEVQRRFDAELREQIRFKEIWLVGYSLHTTVRIY